MFAKLIQISIACLAPHALTPGTKQICFLAVHYKHASHKPCLPSTGTGFPITNVLGKLPRGDAAS